MVQIMSIKIYGDGDFCSKNFWRAIVAEFLGTLLFLLCVTTVALKLGGEGPAANNIEVGIGIGLGIATLAQAFGHVSGGHLNPAVTFGMVVAGKCSVVKGFFYIIVQLVGAIAGSAITYGCTDKSFEHTLGVTLLRDTTTPAQGFTLELIFTFILVFFVFSITDPIKRVEPHGQTFGIGVCIWVCHVCLIPYTTCGINPARSFGPAVIMNDWEDHWVYWAGPMLGGFIAAIFYKFIFYAEPSESENSKTSYQLEKICDA